ncbi:MAG: SDR family oxidoreductase [Chloroflexota bacterium]|nr:SDR family oxidoreductase [Chloroflexota bacterium]
MTAVVSGSTSGIGEATALAFAAEGADVLIHGRDADAAAKIASQVRQLGRRAPVVLEDLSTLSGITALVDQAWQLLGGQVDIWINNAGADILIGQNLHLPYAERLQRLLDVDLRAAVLCSHLAGARMSEQGSGHIINIGWDQAWNGGTGTESGQLFAAAKAGIMGFTKALARGLAPTVRVNCLAPGWIETGWGEQVSRDLHEQLRLQTPLQRWGTPADVAAVAVYLASDAAGFLTGQVLMINGGVVM